MNLYYAPGACSLAPHIVASEAGIPVKLQKVNFSNKTLPDGSDYNMVNPRGYVPALKLEDGDVLTEVNVLVQYLADTKPEAGLLPKVGTKERWKAMQWLAFISTELHKQFGPLFDKTTPEATRTVQKNKLAKRFAELEERLTSNDYILGKEFSVADAYAFTVLNWTDHAGLDMTAYPKIQAYKARVAARPKVKAAMVEEGLVAA
ncbi:glutathione transferase GstA [soil metagenome]